MGQNAVSKNALYFGKAGKYFFSNNMLVEVDLQIILRLYLKAYYLKRKIFQGAPAFLPPIQ